MLSEEPHKPRLYREEGRYSGSVDSLALAFVVPPHSIGVTPAPKSRIERGEQELAELRGFERGHPGTRLKRSADAQFVETRETLRDMGLLRPSRVY